MDETGINWNSESTAPIAEDPAPAPEAPVEENQLPPPSPELPEEKGSAALGVLGALLGAIVGTIPWFLASTFADFFIGWLGFLTAVASAWGYRKLHGRKSVTFATVTVILCSMLTLFGAEIASWMYVLCTDPEWQADAAYYGVSVAQMAWESILMPENWGVILPNLGVGMLIGLLGVLSVRPSVKRYVTGESAPALPAQPGWGCAVRAETAADGPLPTAFVVRDKKWVRVLLRVIGIGDLVFFTGLELLKQNGCLAGEGSDERETLAAVTFEINLYAALGVFLLCNARRKLVVEAALQLRDHQRRELRRIDELHAPRLRLHQGQQFQRPPLHPFHQQPHPWQQQGLLAASGGHQKGAEHHAVKPKKRRAGNRNELRIPARFF